MGDRVSATEFSPEDRLRYRVKVKDCLAALRQLLADQRFETKRKLIGLELELNIADSISFSTSSLSISGQPAESAMFSSSSRPMSLRLVSNRWSASSCRSAARQALTLTR